MVSCGGREVLPLDLQFLSFPNQRYPVNVTTHPNWCGTDWILPPTVYKNGLASVREATGVPLMLYFTSPCDNGGIWKDNYTWSDIAQTGYLLPVPEDTLRFFENLLDYGISRSSTHSDDPWPNAWAPPMVKAGWSGTDMAAYETDFLRSLQMDEVDYRTTYAASDTLLTAINEAASARNMTVQICAGGVPDMLSALDKPSITQARSTIDYAYDFGDPTNNGQFNWAAADGSWWVGVGGGDTLNVILINFFQIPSQGLLGYTSCTFQR